jgi:hypothetical protein
LHRTAGAGELTDAIRDSRLPEERRC